MLHNPSPGPFRDTNQEILCKILSNIEETKNDVSQSRHIWKDPRSNNKEPFVSDNHIFILYLSFWALRLNWPTEHIGKKWKVNKAHLPFYWKGCLLTQPTPAGAKHQFIYNITSMQQGIG